MSNLRRTIGAILLALCMSIVVPTTVPLVQNITTVEAAKVKLSKSKATLIKGQTLKLEVKNTSKNVKWSTTDKKIATVTSSGKVKAKKTGTVTIIAKVGNKQYKCKIKVETPKISNSSLILIKGSSQQISMIGNTQKIKWSTSNKSVATVNSKGKITAKKNGKSTITATIGNKKYTCKVTVSNKFSNAYLTKNTTYDSYVSLDEDYVIVKFNNNATVNINITDISIVYYDSNGNMIYTDTAYNGDILIDANSSGINYFRTPSDSFSNYKISFTSRNAIGDSKYTNKVSLKNKIKVNSSSSSNGVTASFTNTATRTIDYAYVTVLFYKNNKVIGQRTENLYGLESGSTKYIQFSKPYDKNWDYAEFDKYEIYVFDAFYYDFKY